MVADEGRSPGELSAAVDRVAEEKLRYGLGFWLHETGAAVQLEGWDAGVSFRSVHDPERSITYTVLSNTSDGAWPIASVIREWTARSDVVGRS